MINYTPFGHSDWQTIVADIKKFGSAGKKTAVVSTINGDANVPFYKELGNQGIKAKDIPVVAFSVGEEELAGIDTKPLVGHLAAWNYFESIKTPANDEFIKEWHDFTKNPKRVTNDPMEAHYIGFNMWVKAVEKASPTDPDKVIDALPGIEAPNLTGGISKMLPNHHITKPVFIGEIQANGQFDVVWKTPGLVPGDAWSDFLDRLEGPGSPTGCSAELRQLRQGHQEVRRLVVSSRDVPDATSPEGGRCRRSRFRPLGQFAMHVASSDGLAACSAVAPRHCRSQRRDGARGRPRRRARPISPQDDFSETDAGISAVAASGRSARRADHPGAAGRRACCSAPSRRRSSTRTPHGKLLRRGHRQAAVTAARRTTSTRSSINNRLRGIIDAAHRQPDADDARSGQARYERRPGGVQVARCRRACRRSKPAIAKEDDPRIKRADARGARRHRAQFVRRHARPRSWTPSPSIRDRGDQDALGAAVARRRGHAAGRRPAGRRRASTSIARRSRLWDALQNVWYGISLGSVLLLAAIGLAITFGVMGVINMAHGEMVMLGAYTTFVVQQVMRQRRSELARVFARHRAAARLPRLGADRRR